MTLRLLFNAYDIPRTTTRAEWRKIWRWKRETEKALRAELDKRIVNLALYGTSHPEILKDVPEHIINPPLLVIR